MIIKSNESEKRTILRVADLMAAAARTAPKTKGIDNIKVIIITGADKDKLSKKMVEIGERDDMSFFIRDAGCLDRSECALIIGTESRYGGLDCGFCGHRGCEAAEETGSICAFNSIDLGIAIGSAVSVAADNRVDNRVMYSIAKAAMELGYFEDTVKQALGIPLSVFGKNIFFDRK